MGVVSAMLATRRLEIEAPLLVLLTVLRAVHRPPRGGVPIMKLNGKPQITGETNMRRDHKTSPFLKQWLCALLLGLAAACVQAETVEVSSRVSRAEPVRLRVDFSRPEGQWNMPALAEMLLL